MQRFSAIAGTTADHISREEVNPLMMDLLRNELSSVGYNKREKGGGAHG